MASEELIDEMDRLFGHECDKRCSECNMCPVINTFNEIKEVIEKQIPRELTSIRKVKQYDGYDMGNCPICGEPLDNSFYENLKYCFVCGQAIKWEQGEEEGVKQVKEIVNQIK